MTVSPNVYIAGVGMVTAVGNTAAMTAASVNAGVNQARETGVLNKRLRPIKMAQVPEEAVPDIAPALIEAAIPSRQLRMLGLAAAALQDMVAQGLDIGGLPLFLALPENLPGKTAPLKGRFIQQLGMQTDLVFDDASRTISMGRAGGLHAIDYAQKYFAATGSDYLLVGGVETYFDTALLARLDAEDRLNVEGVMDGFIPGEAAAFLLLANETVKDRLPGAKVALAAPGMGSEAGHYYSGEPYLGEGLAAAVSQAIASGGAAPMSELWTSLNGESFGQKELGVALTRNSQSLTAATKIRHPADCLGDTGAACGPAMLGLIHQGAARQPQARSALLCCSSDLEPRAAVTIHVG